MSDGWTCAQKGNLSGVATHLERFPDDIDNPNSAGDYMLVLAVFSGNYETIEYLLEQGADVTVGNINEYFNSAIHMAVARSEYGIVELLIYYGACPTTPNVCGDTALHTAIAWCNIDMVELLLGASDVFINIKNRNDERPIDVAVSYGRLDVALLLLECGSTRPRPPCMVKNDTQKCYNACMEWKPRCHYVMKLRKLHEESRVSVIDSVLGLVLSMNSDVFSELVCTMGL